MYPNNTQAKPPTFKKEHTQPYFMRPSLTRSILNNNPQYSPLFHTCPSCDNFSLKPIGYKNMTPVYIKNHEDSLERQCSLCNYILKPSGK